MQKVRPKQVHQFYSSCYAHITLSFVCCVKNLKYYLTKTHVRAGQRKREKLDKIKTSSTEITKSIDANLNYIKYLLKLVMSTCSLISCFQVLEFIVIITYEINRRGF